MVKLTPDIIQQSMQFINPVRDRELDLRGYKIPVIENMGATLDQFDTIDFSENDVRKLDNFPLLKRLKCLIFNNNRIVRIAEGLEASVPNLESLILTGNLIQELADIDPLVPLTRLSTLCLMNNPVTAKQHYRLYVAFKLPQLKLLDFRKIKMKERGEANALFKSKKGKELQKEILTKSKTFVPGGGLPDALKPAAGGLTPEERFKIRDAIAKAGTLEEMERLNRLLQAGQIPGRPKPAARGQAMAMDPGEEEFDEEEGQGEARGQTTNGN